MAGTVFICTIVVLLAGAVGSTSAFKINLEGKETISTIFACLFVIFYSYINLNPQF